MTGVVAGREAGEGRTAASVAERDLWAEHDGIRVYGRLRVPDAGPAPESAPAAGSSPAGPGAGPASASRPAVICSPFFSGDHETAGEWAAPLAEADIVTCAIDFFGGTPHSRSGGRTTEMSVCTQAADLSALLDVVRALPEVDPARVYLLGQSQGGFVSTMVADERPSDVAGLFLLYPALVIHDDAVERFGAPQNVPDTYEMWMELGRRYAVDALAWDPYEHMSYPGPVRIWQGDADPLVPLAYAERAARTYANAELEVVHDAGHGFYGIRMRRIVAQIAASITDA